MPALHAADEGDFARMFFKSFLFVRTFRWRLNRALGLGQGMESRHGSPDQDSYLLELRLGEPEVQVSLTRSELRQLSLERMAQIWKVRQGRRPELSYDGLSLCPPGAGDKMGSPFWWAGGAAPWWAS
jgi:hypothetical protein